MNMLSLKSTINTIPQSQNPNFDNLSSYTANQLNDPLYFDISSYLMSDDDHGFGNKGVGDCSRGSFNPVLPAVSPRKKVPRRGLNKNKYKTQDECRFAFRTKTQLEIMDDGYKWRKYGKKMVKNSPNPRNYFKCSSGGCKVKKRVERDSLDASYVITTYEGTHNHVSPTCVLYCSPHPSSLL